MRLFRILAISMMFILITTAAAAFASATASTAPLENYVIRAAANSNGLVENGVNQVTFSFTGNITTNGPAKVSYRWIRSDDTFSATKEMRFESAATKTVDPDTWRLTKGQHEVQLWEALEILLPNKLKSKNVPIIVPAGLTFQQTPQIKVIPSITITNPIEHLWIWHLPYLVQWKYKGLAPATEINIDIYDQQGNFTQKYGANIPISQGADGYSCVLLGYSPPGDGYRLKLYCVQDPGIATWSIKFTIKKDP